MARVGPSSSREGREEGLCLHESYPSHLNHRWHIYAVNWVDDQIYLFLVMIIFWTYVIELSRYKYNENASDFNKVKMHTVNINTHLKIILIQKQKVIQG